MKKNMKEENSYHHGDLRNLVLRLAEKTLEEQGVHHLSIRDIATAIGVSHTAPYRHFPRKIDLLFALTTQGFLDLRDTLYDAWKVSEDSFAKLEQAGENYIRLMWEHPRRTELMFGGEVYLESSVPEELQLAGKEAYLALFHIVEYGQKRGDFTNEIDCESLAMFVWSSVHGFAVLNERYYKMAKSDEEKEKLDHQKRILLQQTLKGIKN